MILRGTKKVSALTWDENFAVPPNFTDKQPLARYGTQAHAARKAEPAHIDAGSQPPGSLWSMRSAVIFRRRRENYLGMDSITHFREKVKGFWKNSLSCVSADAPERRRIRRTNRLTAAQNVSLRGAGPKTCDVAIRSPIRDVSDEKRRGIASPFLIEQSTAYFLFAIHAEPSTVTSTMKPPPIMEPQPLFALLITSLAAF